MSYKIIQEIQKAGYVLAIVPHAFEENGVFWYPPSSWSSKKRNLLIKNAYAQPEKLHWVPRPCKVKKKNIKSYALAEENEEQMLAKYVTTETETEEDDNGNIIINSAIGERNRVLTRSPQTSFDDIALEYEYIAEEIIKHEQPASGLLDKITEPPPLHVQIQSEIGEQSAEMVQNDNDEFGHGSINNNIVHLSLDGELNMIIEDQKNIALSQTVVLNELKDLKSILTTGFSKVFTQIDELVKRQRILQDDTSKESVSNIFSTEMFNKISSLEDAVKLEESLKGLQYFSDMVKQMAYIVGKNGKRNGEGWTCCYELVDCFFERSFLVKCSWTGQSTTNEDGKIAFLSFKKTISCFAEIIVNADPNFSINEAKKFFKSLLRNSTRFLKQENQQTRKSSKRVKLPKQSTKNKKAKLDKDGEKVSDENVSNEQVQINSDSEIVDDRDSEIVVDSNERHDEPMKK